ncbi:hypothetical protein SH1V18_07090 [Vallitalea longa]|uniref:Beta-galactosidase n=1 Tax=Vallitalea longa TaxID=2936439 RepID=A0A9W5Y864_9FIRM|nr:sugar-binding domain-containing protein [Vallitalea longa]GKX28229.1 hypothetical protein SH1V18_07090 [Vallitalea longa]
MNIIELNGYWECTLLDKTIDVMVPSCFDKYTEKKDIGTPVRFKKCVEIEKLDHEKSFLYFGGVSYYCDIYVNGQKIGSHEGMWDEFRIEATDYLNVGKNIIELEIIKPGYNDNDKFKVREVLSGFIPDVLCTFGGIWDDISLEMYNSFYVQTHYVNAKIDGTLLFNINLDVFDKDEMKIAGTIISPEGKIVKELNNDLVMNEVGQQKIELECKIDDPLLWDTKNPNLYTYDLTISTDSSEQTITKNFGIREIKSDGSKILLNGKPIYTRGILQWGYYDDEIIPNPSKEVIKEEIKVVKEHGFNMIKHCLYIPRKEYFELADKYGVLLWVELPLWLQDVTDELANRIKREYPRILEQIAGYSSIILISLGCELDASIDSSILENMYHLAKESSQALVRDNSGSGECYDGLPIDFADFFDYHFYADLQNMENLLETFTPEWRNYRPWLFGEFCDIDTMRDLEEIRKEKGVDRLMWEIDEPSLNPVSKLKPDFFAGKHDSNMKKYGIRQEYDLIKELSYNHAMVHRKINLESTRSFPAISGYNITSIRDVSIATSGLFNDLMKPKFDNEEFKKFNSDIVLIPAWDLTRIWLNADRVMSKERYNFFSGDYYGLHIVMSNYHNEELVNPILKWELSYEGNTELSGEITTDKIFETSDVKELGYISITLPETDKPKTYILTANMICNDMKVTNEWPVFLYPNIERTQKGIGVYDTGSILTGIEDLYEIVEIQDEQEVLDVDFVITTRLTPKIKEYIEKGGKALFIQRGKGYLPSSKTAFWRESLIRCYNHEALGGIKYESYLDDLRFFSVSTDTALDVFEFDKMGITEFTPIIRRYDTREWIATDYMTEIKMGKGKVIATTLRLEGGMGKQPMFVNNNRFSRYLIDSVIKYLED